MRLNPKNFKPHADGRKLCINCHDNLNHNIHTGQGTPDIKCDTCHGFPPNITKEYLYGMCDACHAPRPDQDKPSGNLIEIHISRGIYCTSCHNQTDLHSRNQGKVHPAGWLTSHKKEVIFSE